MKTVILGLITISLPVLAAEELSIRVASIEGKSCQMAKSEERLQIDSYDSYSKGMRIAIFSLDQAELAAKSSMRIPACALPTTKDNHMYFTYRAIFSSEEYDFFQFDNNLSKALLAELPLGKTVNKKIQAKSFYKNHTCTFNLEFKKDSVPTSLCDGEKLAVRVKGFKGKNCAHSVKGSTLYVDREIGEGSVVDTAWKSLEGYDIEDNEAVELPIWELPSEKKTAKTHFRFYALHKDGGANHYDSDVAITQEYANSFALNKAVTKEFPLTANFTAEKKRSCTLTLELKRVPGKATKKDPNDASSWETSTQEAPAL